MALNDLKSDVNTGFGAPIQPDASMVLSMLAMSGNGFDPIGFMMAALYKKLSDGKKDELAVDIERVRKELNLLEERSKI